MTTATQRTETTTALSRDQLLRMYRRMYSIREFEEHANDLYLRALMPGLTHLYEGEEAVAVGICEALRPDDYITSTHRGHGHCLAKGAKPDRMFAELLGKEAGYCRGKGGSMHIADPATGNLGANAIVGGSAAIATGAAFSAKKLGNGRICVCFFGEGALGQGVLYEAMNMARTRTASVPIIHPATLDPRAPRGGAGRSGGTLCAVPAAISLMGPEPFKRARSIPQPLQGCLPTFRACPEILRTLT